MELRDKITNMTKGRGYDAWIDCEWGPCAAMREHCRKPGFADLWPEQCAKKAAYKNIACIDRKIV